MFALMIVAALIKDNNLYCFAVLLANDKFKRDCFLTAHFGTVIVQSFVRAHGTCSQILNRTLTMMVKTRFNSCEQVLSY